ncbi:hypothetical protein V5043_23705, partial [Enterobacter kobei]
TVCVVGKMRDLILQLSKSSIYSTKPRGVLKAIVDNKTQRILGASLLCIDSHEMINIVKMVMDAGLPYSILRDQIFTHPSMSESLNDLFSLVK